MKVLSQPGLGSATGAMVDHYFPIPNSPRAGEMPALRFQYARSWVLYTLALDRKSVETYPNSGLPWRPILERARELVQKSVGADEITRQINYCTDFVPEDTPLSHDQFRRLCEIFDLKEPPLKPAQWEYVLENRGMVLKTIQNTLEGKPVPPLIPKLDVISSLTEETQPVVSGFLGEMSKMYKRELGEHIDASWDIDNMLAAIEADRHTLPMRFLKVVVASHGDKTRHYVGSVWMRLYEPPKGVPKSEGKEMEFCYLFVLEAFRNLRIAQYLLYRLHQEASQDGCTALVFEALPQYLEGMLYLRRWGFKPHPERQANPGRVLLTRSTADPFPDPNNQLQSRDGGKNVGL
jgi:GNAT superfamily N-acetyltransferase